MSKPRLTPLFARFVAFLLIPCLVLDPATAASVTAPSIQRQTSIQDFFQQEAVTPPSVGARGYTFSSRICASLQRLADRLLPEPILAVGFGGGGPGRRVGDKESSPFNVGSKGAVKSAPRPVKGVTEAIFPGKEFVPSFSLVEEETAATAAALYSRGLIGLAGRLLNHMPQDALTNDEVIKAMGLALKEHGNDWGVPPDTQDEILTSARKGKFDPKKPSKLVVSAVKDVADVISKKAFSGVNEIVFSQTVRGLKRFFGATEGMGRDALAEGEAFEAGEVLEVAPQRAPGPDDEAQAKIEKTIGLHSRRYSLADVLEGTNAGVGVTETGVAYKSGDVLPENVEIADFSGASSVSVEIKADHESLNTLNADDGYAHVLVAAVPVERREAFKKSALDPDNPFDSLQRIQEAWGQLRPGNVDVIMLNREREKEKIEWLSRNGYHVKIIPDGTLMPSIYAAMGGRFESGRLTVVWTTSGAPEAMMGLAVQKAMESYGAIGAVRLYPRKLKDRWVGNAYLNDDELKEYLTIQQQGDNPESAKAFDVRMQEGGKFSTKELLVYQGLRSKSWRDIVLGKRILTANDVHGDVEVSVTFVTNNKVFGEEGAHRVGPQETIQITTLRLQEIDGAGKAWIQETRGNAKDISNGEAVLVDLHKRYVRAAEDPRSGKLRSPAHGRWGWIAYPASWLEEWGSYGLAKILGYSPQKPVISAQESYVIVPEIEQQPASRKTFWLAVAFPVLWILSAAALGWWDWHLLHQSSSAWLSFPAAIMGGVAVRYLFHPEQNRRIVLTFLGSTFATAGLFYSMHFSLSFLVATFVSFWFLQSVGMSVLHLRGIRMPDQLDLADDLYRARYAFQQRLPMRWHWLLGGKGALPRPLDAKLRSPMWWQKLRRQRAKDNRPRPRSPAGSVDQATIYSTLEAGVRAYLAEQVAGKVIAQVDADANLANTVKNFKLWFEDAAIDEYTKRGMVQAVKQGRFKDITTAYSEPVKFGTAGVRGVAALTPEELMEFKEKGFKAEILKGPGTINNVTLAIVAEGVARHFRGIKEKPKVSIAYDSRIQGSALAELEAALLLKNGCQVYLFDEATPMPEMSYSVAFLKLDFGILISASHNAERYNGFKVSNEAGAQADPKTRDAIMTQIYGSKPGQGETVAPVLPADVKEIIAQSVALRPGQSLLDAYAKVNSHEPASSNLIYLDDREYVDSRSLQHLNFYEMYCEQIGSQLIDRESFRVNLKNLKIVLCSFYGASAKVYPRILKFFGLPEQNLRAVAEYGVPNGLFPRFSAANEIPDPGSHRSWKLVILDYLKQIAKELRGGLNPDEHRAVLQGSDIVQALKGIDIFSGLDPDADRNGTGIPIPAEAVPSDEKDQEAQQIFYVVPSELREAVGYAGIKLPTANDLWMMIGKFKIDRLAEQGKLVPGKKYNMALSHVTTDGLLSLARYAKRKYDLDISIVHTYVGFSLIAEGIQKRWEGDEPEENLIAVEESNGFSVLGGRPLGGSRLGERGHTLEKDGLLAGILLTEIAGWAKAHGKTVYEYMRDDVHMELGYYATTNLPLEFEVGIAGNAKKVATIQNALELAARIARGESISIAGHPVASVSVIVPEKQKYKDPRNYPVDRYKELVPYLFEKTLRDDPTKLFSFFPEEGIRFYFDRAGGERYLTIRPSGTEPKLRFYVQWDEQELTSKTYVSRVLEADRITQSLALATQELVKVREQSDTTPKWPDFNFPGSKVIALLLTGLSIYRLTAGVSEVHAMGLGDIASSAATASSFWSFTHVLLLASISIGLVQIMRPLFVQRRPAEQWEPLTAA